MTFPIKLVLLGESGVGKTCVINRYLTGMFQGGAKPTIGASFLTKEVQYDNENYDLMIWDTAGQEEYRGLAPMYYRNAAIAVVMFDISSRSSYEALEFWISDLKENASSDISIIICANKIDLNEDRFADKTEFMDFATKNGTQYVETSALTGEGIDMLFQAAVSSFAKMKSGVKQAPPTTNIKGTEPQQNGCGC